jgi:hypothetical protein
MIASCSCRDLGFRKMQALPHKIDSKTTPQMHCPDGQFIPLDCSHCAQCLGSSCYPRKESSSVLAR